MSLSMRTREGPGAANTVQTAVAATSSTSSAANNLGMPVGDATRSDESDAANRRVSTGRGSRLGLGWAVAKRYYGPMTMTVLLNVVLWLAVPPPGYGGDRECRRRVGTRVAASGRAGGVGQWGSSTLVVDGRISVFDDGQFARLQRP